MLPRQEIQDKICNTLMSLEIIEAIWISGSAAFNRSDELSDIDIRVLANLTDCEQIFKASEQALSELSTIQTKYKVPDNTYPNHRQCFYLLKDASPYHMVDLVIMDDKMLQPHLVQERHGIPIVIVDRYNKIRPHNNIDDLSTSFKARAKEISSSFPILSRILVERAIKRNRFAESIGFYHARVLTPLIELLRAKYCPIRQDFGVRYLHWDLPEAINASIDELYSVANFEDLRDRLEKAEKLFYSTIKNLELDIS